MSDSLIPTSMAFHRLGRRRYGLWSLASRWFKVAVTYGALGVAYWLALLLFGHGPYARHSCTLMPIGHQYRFCCAAGGVALRHAPPKAGESAVTSSQRRHGASRAGAAGCRHANCPVSPFGADFLLQQVTRRVAQAAAVFQFLAHAFTRRNRMFQNNSDANTAGSPQVKQIPRAFFPRSM